MTQFLLPTESHRWNIWSLFQEAEHYYLHVQDRHQQTRSQGDARYLIYCQTLDMTNVDHLKHACLQVTVNYRPTKLPFSRHSLYVEDTGSMYLIHTPGGISIQWYHSTGIMVLQYNAPYNASVPTHGLCGESTRAHTHSSALPTLTPAHLSKCQRTSSAAT